MTHLRRPQDGRKWTTAVFMAAIPDHSMESITFYFKNDIDARQYKSEGVGNWK